MMILLIILITTSILLIVFISNYNKLQTAVLKVNQVESNIDSILRKRFDLLNKIVNTIKEIEPQKDTLLNEVENLRTKRLTNFELDRKIYENLNEVEKFKLLHPKLAKSEAYLETISELEGTESEINACKKYYNDNITKYNKMVSRFPGIIIGTITKNKPRPYFDGKNMNDDIYDDFKL